MKGRGKVVGKKNVVSVVPQKQQQQQQQLLKAPIASMRNMLEIERYFNERILDQCTSIRNLSSHLAAMMHERQYTNSKRKQQDVVMVVLAGPSSTGKSKTMRRMRELLGMAENYEYEGLFIEYYVKPADYDPGDNEASYGSAVRDRQDIATRIKDALKIAAVATTPPPYVMLFVHNFSHTTYPSGLINSLVYGGGGGGLAIPQGTKLLIMCTCHYGSEKIAGMSQRYDDTAEQYIRDDMRRGVVDTTMNRIDMFLPYYPLTRNVIKQLLGKRLDKFVQASGIVEHIGAQALKTDPAMKEMLINHILGKGDTVSGGLHNYVCALENKLGQLLQAGTTAYNGLQKKPPSDTIHLESTSFETSYFGQILVRQLDEETSDFIKSLRDDPRNQQVLANCDPNRAGTVDSVNMRYGVNPLCGLVMNVNYVTINNYYDTQETAKITEELKARNKKLKGCLIAVNAAVEKEPHGAIGGIIKNNKELFNESSDDSGEEATTTPSRSLICATITTKRKADNQLSESPASPEPQLKKPRLKAEEEVVVVVAMQEEDTGVDYYPLDELVFSDEQPYSDIDFNILQSDEEWEYVPPVPKKKGRPYTEVKGFRRMDQANGRPAWQCKACEQALSKVLYTRNHKCR